MSDEHVVRPRYGRRTRSWALLDEDASCNLTAIRLDEGESRTVHCVESKVKTTVQGAA